MQMSLRCFHRPLKVPQGVSQIRTRIGIHIRIRCYIHIRIRVRGERRAIELAKKTIIYLNCGSRLYKTEKYAGCIEE